MGKCFFFLECSIDNAPRKAQRDPLVFANSNTSRNAFAKRCLLPLKEWESSSGILLFFDLSFFSSLFGFWFHYLNQWICGLRAAGVNILVCFLWCWLSFHLVSIEVTIFYLYMVQRLTAERFARRMLLPCFSFTADRGKNSHILLLTWRWRSFIFSHERVNTVKLRLCVTSCRHVALLWPCRLYSIALD